MKTVGVGIIGCGVVGGGVWKHWERNRKLMNQRTGINVEIRRIAERDSSKVNDLPPEIVTNDWRALLNDPQVNVIVELVGGTTIAKEIAEAAIRAGKPLVTANKALLAELGNEICGLADQKGTPIYFEASVGGGIPIIKALKEGLRANDVKSIHGIVNGTCNYILSRMSEDQMSFETALAEAKRLGYAEANESLDVDGMDAAHKAAILASLAYGFWVNTKQVYVEGIRKIEEMDIALAKKFGYAMKLLAIIRADKSKHFSVRVHPTLIPEKHILASVSGVYNAIAVEGDVVGHTLFYGRGAGADAAASAVLNDIYEAGMDWVEERKPSPLVRHDLFGKPVAMDDVKTRYYMRLTAVDKPGVLAQIAAILGNHQVGISSVFQPQRSEGNAVPLVIITDHAKEGVFMKAIQDINALPVTKGNARIIRVEDLS
ncbi:MAG: homoserine dehydrogenase [Verrucomicrobiota bacterium]